MFIFGVPFVMSRTDAQNGVDSYYSQHYLRTGAYSAGARNSGFSDCACPQVRCTAEYMPCFRYILHLTLSIIYLSRGPLVNPMTSTCSNGLNSVARDSALTASATRAHTRWLKRSFQVGNWIGTSPPPFRSTLIDIDFCPLRHN